MILNNHEFITRKQKKNMHLIRYNHTQKYRQTDWKVFDPFEKRCTCTAISTTQSTHIPTSDMHLTQQRIKNIKKDDFGSVQPRIHKLAKNKTKMIRIRYNHELKHAKNKTMKMIRIRYNRELKPNKQNKEDDPDSVQPRIHNTYKKQNKTKKILRYNYPQKYPQVHSNTHHMFRFCV